MSPVRQASRAVQVRLHAVDDAPGSQRARRFGRRQWLSASGQALVVVAGLLATVAVLLLVPGYGGAAPSSVVVGETEPVRLTAPDGTTVETVARVDTGASSSSIDRALAEDLGLDLANAPSVKVRSSLGVEERPVVGVAIQVAGEARPARVTVADRSGLREKVLLGREQLHGFRVAVGQSLLTNPGAVVAPSAAEALLLHSSPMPPATLLALLPLCALLIVVLRLWVGLSTLGTFGPVLLGIGYVQAGVLVGLGLTVSLFTLGMVVQVGLRRARLPRVARLGVLISLVATALAALQASSSPLGTAAVWGAALPVVVTSTVIERLWETWDDDGARAAGVDAMVTLGVSLLVAGLLLAPHLRYLAETVPLYFAVACVCWTWAAGSYKGLRLSELVRFAPVMRGLPDGRGA